MELANIIFSSDRILESPSSFKQKYCFFSLNKVRAMCKWHRKGVIVIVVIIMIIIQRRDGR